LRSLNVAMAVAMALGEALRQTGRPVAGGTGSEEKV
jgi:tRNA(Leu) C34 or U34 (ribose-2'-O)-methylase TrmL